MRRLGQPLDVHVPDTSIGDEFELPSTMLMQEILDVEFPNRGDIENTALPEMLSVIAVLVQDELAEFVDAPLLGVPLPVIVMPTLAGTVTPLVQVQEPDGI